MAIKDPFFDKLGELLVPIVKHAESGGLNFVFLLAHKDEGGVVTMANVMDAERQRIVEAGLAQVMAKIAMANVHGKLRRETN